MFWLFLFSKKTNTTLEKCLLMGGTGGCLLTWHEVKMSCVLRGLFRWHVPIFGITSLILMICIGC